MISPRKKKHLRSNSGLANELRVVSSESQVTQQLQLPTSPQSDSQSPREKQQSQHVCPWSAHAPRLGQSPSPFPRDSHAVSTRVTSAGGLFLFGGYAHGSRSLSNDLYSVSTRDFSTTLLPTSGDVPSPRFAHCAVFVDATSTLLIWGGATNLSDLNNDDSLYMLSLASPLSRDWIRIEVNSTRPGGRYGHTMTSDGSKLFVFGGMFAKKCFNDIWAFDLNRLESNPFWESYEPTAGNKKPLPRACHVSITTDDRIIIFGGFGNTDNNLNDTWLFNISTRKWTELQCTGSIPSPRRSHAAVLIDDIMYVYGGHSVDGTYLGDLTALNLSTRRWTAFQDVGTGPCGRRAHAMASDGRRIFVFGGILSQGTQTDEAKLIHVLDTKLLNLPKPDSNIVKHSEKTIQLAQKLPSSQLHLKGLLSGSTGASGRSKRVPEQDDDGKGSTEHHVKPVSPDAPSRKEIAKDGRFVDLERQLSETLVAQNERDQRIAQLTDELALKSALLERAEANAAEDKKRAGQELRELQEKFDELLLSRDRALEQTQNSLQKASLAAEANERSQRELAEVHAKLEARDSELAAVRLRLAETDGAKGKAVAADTYRDQNAMGLVDTDESRVVHRLMERVQAMEAEVASLRWNEKSFEMMECRNEG